MGNVLVRGQVGSGVGHGQRRGAAVLASRHRMVIQVDGSEGRGACKRQPCSWPLVPWVDRAREVARRDAIVLQLVRCQRRSLRLHLRWRMAVGAGAGARVAMVGEGMRRRVHAEGPSTHGAVAAPRRLVWAGVAISLSVCLCLSLSAPPTACFCSAQYAALERILSWKRVGGGSGKAKAKGKQSINSNGSGLGSTSPTATGATRAASFSSRSAKQTAARGGWTLEAVSLL